jgi:photosystem II stability/assembly factor-like uncharacterized protein
MSRAIRNGLASAVCVLSLLAGPGPVGAGDKVWSRTGPEGGAVDALAISPNFAVDGTLFAGTNAGGMFRTTDGGATWAEINNGLTNLTVYVAGISPDFANDSLVLAGTNYSGLFRSTDAGASWAQVPAPLNSGEIKGIAFSPNFAADRTLYVSRANSDALYRSTDGGANWTDIRGTIPSIGGGKMVCSPAFAADNTLVIAAGGGVYKSTNRGTSWTAINTGLSSTALADLRTIAFSPAYAADSTLFLGTGRAGIWRSTDGGTSWTAINTGHSPQKDVGSIVISPNFATDRTLFTGCPSWQGFKSTNGGDSWTMYQFNIDWIDEGNRINPDVWAMAMSPNFPTDRTLFVGTFGTGVLKSTDASATWSISRSGMMAQRMSAIAVSPNFGADRTVYVSSGGAGVFASTDGGLTWHSKNAQTFSLLDTYALIISPDFANDGTLFAGNHMGMGNGRNGITRTTDGGASWTNPETGLENRNVRALAFSPDYANDHTVFAGTLCIDFPTCTDSFVNGVFKSTDGGNTWARALTGLPKRGIYTIAVSPGYASDGTLFAGMWEGGVYKSTNGGANWSNASTGLGNLRVWSVALSPAFATDATLFAGTDGGLYRSTNGGASWTHQSNTIGTRRVTSIVVSSEFATDRTLYCGSNYGGVLRSTDGGATWATFVSGLGHTYVQAMGISRGANPTVFAGTVGGSVWQYSYSGPFQRALGQGWQLMSIPRILTDSAPETVLASIAGKYDLVYAWDASDPADPWKCYSPGNPGSDLTYISRARGLWIRMTQAATLTVEGEMPTTTSVPLYAGWNLIGYPAGVARAVPDAMASVAGKYTLVYEYDPNAAGGSWRSYSASAPGYANTLQQMRPGYGYWVKATEDCMLTVGW